MTEWSTGPLDSVYAAVFIDATVAKVREGQAANRPIYAAIGVTVDGRKDSISTAVDADAALAALDALDDKWGSKYRAMIRLCRDAWAGSSGALPRRSPLRTGRASRPRVRLKRTQRCHEVLLRGVVRVRCAARPCGRSECARGVKREDRSVSRPAGRR